MADEEGSGSMDKASTLRLNNNNSLSLDTLQRLVTYSS